MKWNGSEYDFNSNKNMAKGVLFELRCDLMKVLCAEDGMESDDDVCLNGRPA